MYVSMFTFFYLRRGSVRVVVFNNATLNNISVISSDFLKFVFILVDIGPAPRNFLLDSLNFCWTYISYVKLF